MDKGKLYDQEESQRKKVIDLGQVAHHVLILKAVGLLGGKHQVSLVIEFLWRIKLL